MNVPTIKQVCLLGIGLVLLFATALGANEYAGTVKLGYIYIDDEGNRGVQQPTYNLYEGAALSLEKMSYRFDNGVRLFGDLRNVTLNNRNIRVGAARSGHFGFTFKNSQYRRVYGFDGESFTRRRQTFGQLWVQPLRWLRLSGGYGRIDKHGETVDLIEPPGVSPIRSLDYSQNVFNFDARLQYERKLAEVTYRTSDFTDDIDNINDRKSQRIRAIAVTPLPYYQNILLNAGFQRFENKIEDRSDTLTANTVWGGARWFYGDGYSLKYSFIFDRARRTGDLSATDNIAHAVYIGKKWLGRAAVTLGYQHHINDDIADALSSNSYYFSGWLRVLPRVTLKAGLGFELTEVNEGRTLTGDRDLTRLRGSVEYQLDHGSIRMKVANKETENEDIGTSADYLDISTDGFYQVNKYGEIRASYSYREGDYDNTESSFSFHEHVVTGDFLTAAYRHLQVGFGGMYMRSKRDLDVESFQVSFTGIYSLSRGYKVEAVYSAFNFDNFDDPSPIYSQYYTSNIVEVSVSKGL